MVQWETAANSGKQRQTGGYEFRFVQTTTTASIDNEVWMARENAFVSSFGRF